MAPIFVELRASVGEFKAKMGEASHEIEHLGKKGAGSFDKLATVGRGALLGVLGVATAVGGIAVHAAIQGEAAHARLAQAVKNAGGSMEEIEPQVHSLSDKFAKLGFTNDEVETALGSMTTALGNPEKAMDNLGLAADLARYKHISLAESSVIVAKAMEGQLKPLKALGIDLPVAAGGALKLAQAHARLEAAQGKVNAVLAKYPDAAKAASKHHKEYEAATEKVRVAQTKLSAVQGAASAITKGLAHAVGGQASAASLTFAGRMETAKAQAENLAEKLGNHLLPMIVSLIGKVSSIVTWFEHHTTTAKVLAGVLGGALLAAITAYIAQMVIAAASTVANFATMVAAGAMWFFEQLAGWASLGVSVAIVLATMVVEALTWAAGMLVAGATAMLPFLPLIALVAAVGFAAYELYKHWDAVWGGIKAVTSAVWNWLKSAFGTLIHAYIWWLKTEIHALQVVWSAVWGVVKSVVSGAWDVLKGIFNGIVHGGLWLVKKEIQGLHATWSAAWGVIKSVVQSVWDFIKPIFDKITGAIGAIGKGLGAIKGAVGGAAGGAAHLLGFADGGPVPGPRGAPHLAVVHGGEYVISNGMQTGTQSYGGPVFGGGGGGDAGGLAAVTTVVQIDGREIHRSVQTQELRYQERNGRRSA